MEYLLNKLLSTLISKTNSFTTDSYTIADDDADGSTKYFGFLREVGDAEHWYILRIITNAGVNSYRYSAGNGALGNYSDNTSGAWAKRTSLDYKLPNLVDFK